MREAERGLDAQLDALWGAMQVLTQHELNKQRLYVTDGDIMSLPPIRPSDQVGRGCVAGLGCLRGGMEGWRDGGDRPLGAQRDGLRASSAPQAGSTSKQQQQHWASIILPVPSSACPPTRRWWRCWRLRGPRWKCQSQTRDWRQAGRGATGAGQCARERGHALLGLVSSSCRPDGLEAGWMAGSQRGQLTCGSATPTAA